MSVASHVRYVHCVNMHFLALAAEALHGVWFVGGRSWTRDRLWVQAGPIGAVNCDWLYSLSFA